MKCPACGRECDRDSVDNGVAVIVGPWGCDCGWSEDEAYDTRKGPVRIAGGYVDSRGGWTRITRERILTAEEAERYEDVRAKVESEFPLDK